MPIFLTNRFIFIGILTFTLLFLTGINNLSVPVSFLSLDSIDTRLLVMFLLAEPHFAMTIPLLYGYRKNFICQPINYLYIPIIIIIISSILFFYKSSLFFLIFLIANIYHVNRQSTGFLKLQAKFGLAIAKIYEVNLHIFTIICLYFALISEAHGVKFALYILFASLLFMVILVRIMEDRLPTLRESFIIMQGKLIFLPIVIFEDILLAFAVGISIHYIQYLSISWTVIRKGVGISIMPIVIILLLYSVFSTGALGGFFTTERISIIVFIPTLMQLLHFYYDGLIWRRSDKFVAEIMKKSFS